MLFQIYKKWVKEKKIPEALNPVYILFPSIEFWFLIHFLDTNRRFQNSSETETLLKNYIEGYRKTKTFLEKEKWVADLCSDGKLETAIQRAKQYSDRSGSYSNVYKAFEMLSLPISGRE